MQQIAVCNEILCKVAKIVSCFKIEGEIKISSEFSFDDLKEIFSICRFLFIYDQNIFPVKIEILSIKFVNNSLILKLKNYNSIDLVKTYIGFNIYVKKECLDDFFYKTKHPISLVGFDVFDFSNKYLAKVKSVIIDKQNKIVLDNEDIIPFVSEFILKIDYDEAKLYLNLLPKGLIQNA